MLSARDAQVFERHDVERLALGFHDVRQLDETGFVEAQVHGDHGRQVDLDGLQAHVHFAHDRSGTVVQRQLGGKGGLRPVPQRGQHLAGLAVVVVDGLLAEDDQSRLLALNDLEQRAGHAQRLQRRHRF